MTTMDEAVAKNQISEQADDDKDMQNQENNLSNNFHKNEQLEKHLLDDQRGTGEMEPDEASLSHDQVVSELPSSDFISNVSRSHKSITLESDKQMSDNSVEGSSQQPPNNIAELNAVSGERIVDVGNEEASQEEQQEQQLQDDINEFEDSHAEKSSLNSTSHSAIESSENDKIFESSLDLEATTTKPLENHINSVNSVDEKTTETPSVLHPAYHSDSRTLMLEEEASIGKGGSSETVLPQENYQFTHGEKNGDDKGDDNKDDDNGDDNKDDAIRTVSSYVEPCVSSKKEEHDGNQAEELDASDGSKVILPTETSSYTENAAEMNSNRSSPELQHPVTTTYGSGITGSHDKSPLQDTAISPIHMSNHVDISSDETLNLNIVTTETEHPDTNRTLSISLESQNADSSSSTFKTSVNDGTNEGIVDSIGNVAVKLGNKVNFNANLSESDRNTLPVILRDDEVNGIYSDVVETVKSLPGMAASPQTVRSC